MFFFIFFQEGHSFLFEKFQLLIFLSPVQTLWKGHSNVCCGGMQEYRWHGLLKMVGWHASHYLLSCAQADLRSMQALWKACSCTQLGEQDCPMLSHALPYACLNALSIIFGKDSCSFLLPLCVYCCHLYWFLLCFSVRKLVLYFLTLSSRLSDTAEKTKPQRWI